MRLLCTSNSTMNWLIVDVGLRQQMIAIINAHYSLLSKLALKIVYTYVNVCNLDGCFGKCSIHGMLLAKQQPGVWLVQSFSWIHPNGKGVILMFKTPCFEVTYSVNPERFQSEGLEPQGGWTVRFVIVRLIWWRDIWFVIYAFHDIE